MYIASAGTNTQKLINLLETMFGDLYTEDLELEQFESDTTKALCQEAAKAEGASVMAEHGPILTDKITCVMVISTPVSIEYGIPEATLPETKNIKMPLTKNPAKKVTQFYYSCRVCSHSSQNKPSMITHTPRCLLIKLVCKVCKKEYESSKGVENHISEMHKGYNDPDITDTETEMVSE